LGHGREALAGGPRASADARLGPVRLDDRGGRRVDDDALAILVDGLESAERGEGAEGGQRDEELHGETLTRPPGRAAKRCTREGAAVIPRSAQVPELAPRTGNGNF